MTRTAPIRPVATEPDAATKAFRGERYDEFSHRDPGIDHIGGQSIRATPVRFPPSVGIRLAAPTGKAAARLNESIAGQVGRPARGPAAPCAVILLGDKDKLASVEAGSILGDLCAHAEGGHYTPATADWLSEATWQRLPDDVLDAYGQPIDQSIAMLRVSHRFTAESGIGQLAASINAPLARDDHSEQAHEKRAAIRRVLGHGYADLSHFKLNSDDTQWLARLAVTGYPEGFPQNGHSAAAGRTPPVGTGDENDYGLGLMNGDIGITRACHWLTLVETGRGQLLDAAQRRVMRVSGSGR